MSGKTPVVITPVHRRGKTVRVPPPAPVVSRSRLPRIGSGLGAGFDEWSISTWKRCEKLASLCSGREFTCDIFSLATEGDRGGARRGDPTQLEKIEAEIRKELAALSVSWVPAYERRSCG